MTQVAHQQGQPTAHLKAQPKLVLIDPNISDSPLRKPKTKSHSAKNI